MHVVFFRNLNLGHRSSPDRDQLERAVLAAGAQRAKSFQTNGTVLIRADDPDAVVEAATARLTESSGYRDAGIVRSVESLRTALGGRHFEGFTDARTYRETFTFFRGGRPLSWSLPWTNARDDVDIVHVCDGMALAVIRKARSTAGNPTAEVERATGGVATTRTRGTIERLLTAAATW